MNNKRAFEIINNKEICDVYYKEHPVWIQEIKNDVAKIGFMNLTDEKTVNIEELHENA